MFFKRKKQKDTTSEYFKYRDSLTGCMNETFAVKTFKELKANDGYGAVMVRLGHTEDMSMYEGEILIKETAAILNNIYAGDISRLEFADFLIYTDNVEIVADRINYFLVRLTDDKRHYFVGGKRFDEHEKDYSCFIKRLRRAVAVAELMGGKKAIY